MAIINQLLVKQNKPRGVIVGGVWNNKVGMGLNFKSKATDASGKVVDLKEPFSFLPGEGLLILPNGRKREGRKDPDFVVYAYPSKK